MGNIGVYAIPCIIFIILIFGIYKKVSVFDEFVIGAKEGFSTTITLLPTLIGLITAVEMFKVSGALDLLTTALAPIGDAIGFPKEVLPLVLLRPVSGGGSVALADSVFSQIGPDSFGGRVASVLMGSTETTFYAIAVYFGSVNIKKTRHAVPCALIADFAAFVFSAIVVRMMFY